MFTDVVSSDGLSDSEAGTESFCPREIANLAPSECAIFCVEPGMGCTKILSRAVIEQGRREVKARYVNLRGKNQKQSLAEIRKNYRWATHLPKPTSRMCARAFLAFDDLTVGDESFVDVAADTVRKCLEAGCVVLIATTPDGEPLAEALREAYHFWSCDLCAPRPESAVQAELYDQLTHGIPVLAEAVRKTQTTDLSLILTDPSYQEPLIEVCEESLRESLIFEEKRLRLTLLLLGQGTRADAEEVVGPLDDDAWHYLSRDAPLFGIDVVKGTFQCVGASSLDCLNIMFATLMETAHAWPSLVAGAAAQLMSHNEVARAAVVSLMCSDVKQREAIALRWGTRMIDAGEMSVVADALESAYEGRRTRIRGYTESLCLCTTLAGKSAVDVLMLAQEIEGNTVEGRHALLALRCMGIKSGQALEVDEAEPAIDDPTEMALTVRADALELLSKGKIADAYDLLDRSAVRHDESSLCAALVEVGYVVCSLLMGSVPGSLDSEGLRDALVVLERAGLSDLLRLSNFSMAALGILAGRSSGDESFEALVQWCDRRGDALLQGFFLMASGVADLRSGAMEQAHVRFNRARESFGRMKAEALCKIACILDLVVRAQSGDKITRDELAPFKGITRALDQAVILLEAAVLSTDGRFPGMRLLAHAQYPFEAHWLLNVLAYDCGTISQRLRHFMPESWQGTLMRVSDEVDGYLERRGYVRRSSLVVQGAVPKGDDSLGRELSLVGPPVRVKLLGGFEVRLDGQVLPSGRLESRRAKALLTLLCAVPDHVAKRLQIIESIWPDRDYLSANKCLYSATSALRREFGTVLRVGVEGSPVVASRSESTVGLNMALVECDVDQFESKARGLHDVKGNDELVVSVCRELEELYRGDLFVPPTDGAGIVETRLRELRSLFADAMVAGALAATALGMRTQACRFARKAHSADDMREDAVRVLVQVLCAAGRHVEAEHSYERYVGRVVDLTRKPPSKRLRAQVDELLETAVNAPGSSLSPKDEGGFEIVPPTSESGSGQMKLPFDESA